MTRGKTKDEQFILRLYELGLQTGDMEAKRNKYDINKAVGLAARATNTICIALTQANFIKKIDNDTIQFTAHGKELALRLLRE